MTPELLEAGLLLAATGSLGTRAGTAWERAAGRVLLLVGLALFAWGLEP